MGLAAKGKAIRGVCVGVAGVPLHDDAICLGILALCQGDSGLQHGA